MARVAVGETLSGVRITASGARAAKNQVDQEQYVTEHSRSGILCTDPQQSGLAFAEPSKRAVRAGQGTLDAHKAVPQASLRTTVDSAHQLTRPPL